MAVELAALGEYAEVELELCSSRFVKPLPEATPRYMFERVFDSVVEMVAVKPCSARMV